MIFRKGGKLERNSLFKYGHTEQEIVSKYTYLGIVFTTEGSYNTAQSTLSGQAQKNNFYLEQVFNKVYKFRPEPCFGPF